MWAQRTYGANFLNRLAAQRPRIYLGTGPINQAIISGEIIGAPMAAGTALVDKANGAPIDYKIPNKGLERPALRDDPQAGTAPERGTAASPLHRLAGGAGGPERRVRRDLPEHQGAFYAPPNHVRLNDYTPAKIAEFQEKWNALFVG